MSHSRHSVLFLLAVAALAGTARASSSSVPVLALLNISLTTPVDNTSYTLLDTPILDGVPGPLPVLSKKHCGVRGQVEETCIISKLDAMLAKVTSSVYPLHVVLLLCRSVRFARLNFREPGNSSG